MVTSDLNSIKPLEKNSSSVDSVDYIQYVKERKAQEKDDISHFVCADAKMKKIKEVIEQVACTPVSVLITGESGTGKEVLAKYIHNMSNRANQPFVAINCAALPPSLLESELFGFEKGAFTGAHQRHIGKFELASEGTLLLDEVTEIDPNLQAKLLRAIQEKEIERIGGRETVKINTRIIATSNRNLEKSVAEGTFRQDLYYRLHVIPLEIPPLRSRPGDIDTLSRYFLKKYEREYGKSNMSFSQEAMDILMQHKWPGNVRELQNVVHRAVLMSADLKIAKCDLPIAANDTEHEPWIKQLPIGNSLKNLETTFILETLKHHRGNRTHTAKTLGISLRTLRNKINEFTKSGIRVMEPQGSFSHD